MINISDFDREDLWLYCMTESIFTILDIYDNILEEGACQTNKKRKLDKYLSKYNYKGDKNEGTIEVDGKTYHIDRNTNSKKMIPHGEIKYPVNRSTSGEIASIDGKKHIHLDKNFEKLKNNKRRDAALQHEIGHVNLHHVIDSNTTDGRSMVKQAFGLHDDNYNENLHYPETAKEKIRSSNIKKFQLHDINNALEFEADTYSKAHKNGDQIGKTIRESAKYNRKNKDHLYNKNMEDHIQKRVKVLKDKSINLNAYK